VNFETIEMVDAGSVSRAWMNETADLKERFNEGKLALLVGSGISQYEPSNAPPAAQVAQGIQYALAKSLPLRVARAFAEHTPNVPFEVLMARLAELNDSLARRVVSELTSVESPNLIHRQVSSLLRRASCDDRRFTVLTTNYDLGITLAFQSMAGAEWRPITTVVEEADLSQKPTPAVLFHVHGALDQSRSLVIDYKAEFALEGWKVDFLRERLCGTTMLVLGFSGFDLDMCKALRACSLRRILWVRSSYETCTKRTKWSQDSLLLMERHGEVNAVNASRRLELALHGLDGANAVERPTVSELAFPKRMAAVRKTLDTEGTWLKLWAAWTGLRAGFAWAPADLIPSDYGHLPYLRRLEVEGFVDYYAGRHLTGASKHGEAARVAREELDDLGQYLYFRNNEVEFLCRGAFTGRAVFRIVATLARVGWERGIRRRRLDQVAIDEVHNLRGSFWNLWPMGAAILLHVPDFGLGRSVLAHEALRLEGRDLDKYLILKLIASLPGSAAAQEAEANYAWLGQAGRLVNLHRFRATGFLFEHHRTGIPRHAVEAERLGRLAARWSRDLGDRCRWAKSVLVRIEARRLARVGMMTSRRARAEAAVAWRALREVEISGAQISITTSLYCLGSYVPGYMGQRLRLSALALLETC
jgi:hypothetical protein